MSARVVVPPNSPPPLAPYSPGMLANGILYVSGMLAIDEKGNTVAPGDVQLQTRHVLESVRKVIAAAEGSMKDVVLSQIFLKSLDDYAAMNAIYAEYFPIAPPARYCIRADLVRPEFLVEISVIAHLSRQDRPFVAEVA